MSIAGRVARTSNKVDAHVQSLRGRVYRWRCVADTSEGKPFQDNLFRHIDVIAGGFAEGTIFEDVHTGEKITYQD
jgi:hypothetical protein